MKSHDKITKVLARDGKGPWKKLPPPIPAHELLHSVRDVALILGVGKDRLFNAMKDAGLKTSDKITVATGFTALSAKFQKQATLTRRQEAEADSAEMDAAQKKGQLMLKKDAALLWADATIETRKVIQRLLSPKEAGRVLNELGKIKLGDAK